MSKSKSAFPNKIQTLYSRAVSLDALIEAIRSTEQSIRREEAKHGKTPQKNWPKNACKKYAPLQKALAAFIEEFKRQALEYNDLFKSADLDYNKMSRTVGANLPEWYELQNVSEEGSDVETIWFTGGIEWHWTLPKP